MHLTLCWPNTVGVAQGTNGCPLNPILNAETSPLLYRSQLDVMLIIQRVFLLYWKCPHGYLSYEVIEQWC